MNQGWNLVEVEFSTEVAREIILIGGNIFGEDAVKDGLRMEIPKSS